jgi:hypothetical protein
VIAAARLALTGSDLLAWTQMLLLDDDLATAEPKKLRYRLLHVAARITRTARRTRLRIAEHWPWKSRSRHRLQPAHRTVPTGQLNPTPHPDKHPRRNPVTRRANAMSRS